MPGVTTAIVSDFHLGTGRGRDLLRRERVLAALVAALEGVDHLVLLGDILELREGPVADAVAVAAPVLGAIGRAMKGRPVTIVAGNHDHQLAAPLVEQLRLEGRTLEPDTRFDTPAEGPAAEVARALAPAEPRLAYPGLWVRGDVYATHGHYLDVHNTVPSFERIAIGAVQRVRGPLPPGRSTPDDYEAAVAPVYALAYALAQSPNGGRAVRSDVSASVWRSLTGSGIKPRLLAGLAVPAAVGALNAAGLGPLGRDLTGVALRDAALRGMREVVGRMGLGAAHVIFGHTHRSGPHPGDGGDWGPLMNIGSWIHEPVFLGSRPRESPYFPGHMAVVEDEGPPTLRALLGDLQL